MPPTTSLQKKLDELSDHIRELRDIQPPNFEAFESDKMLRRYAERMLHLTIEDCIRIGIEVLSDAGFRAPENYHDLFVVLGEHSVLTPALVNSMTLMVEFRNLLVYEHDVVDHMMVYSILKKRLEDFEEYKRGIVAFASGVPYVPSPLFETEPDDGAAPD